MNIDNIKKAFKSVIKLGNSVAEVLEDGKVSLVELPGLAIASTGIPQLVEDAKAALTEFKAGIDSDEALEIGNFFKEQFDISNDQLEVHIENGMDLLIRTYDTGLETYNLYKGWSSWVEDFKALKAA
jgi:hypothetical protein